MIFAHLLNGNMPEFGLVKNMFVVDSRVFCFEYQPFQTICFDRNIMAYQVEVPHLGQATELVDAEKLVDYTSNYTNQQQEANLGPGKIPSWGCNRIAQQFKLFVVCSPDITWYLNGQNNVMATFIFQIRCAHSL